jgi:hypothetical protein
MVTDFEDGILAGNEVPIDRQYRNQLPVVFENLLKNKHISGSKSALEFADNNVLTFTQVREPWIFSEKICLN